MATILPLALEALMREQGRNVPNEQDMGMLGMPTGIPFTNQAPYTPRRTPMDGSLGMLSALISGLSGHAGEPYDEQVGPRNTHIIRTFLQPGSMEPYSHESAMVPSDQTWNATGAAIDQMQANNRHARMGTSMDARIAQANAAKTGEGMGIVDPERHAAWKQGMADDEAARRGLVNQRAMQVAQARTNRQSGMHPQLAAILAAVGGNSDLGQLALGDAVGGRGTGLQLREQNLNQDARNRAIDAQREKNDAANPAVPDLKAKAATIYATKLEASRGDKAKAAQESLIEIMKTGVTEAEAKAVLAEVAGVEERQFSPAGKPKESPPLMNAWGRPNYSGVEGFMRAFGKALLPADWR